MIDIVEFRNDLIENNALCDEDEIRTESVDRISPKYADEFPSQLHSSVRDALIRVGITQLYQHQAEAMELSLSGTDVILESPTASGKTLAFTAPMLDALVRNRQSRALMIYPMKALALDQRSQIQDLCDLLSIESYPYDGDTGDEHKKLLAANPPGILLTNPEYLNMSFLAFPKLWDEKFLRLLQYVVIDEIHEYRGFFGGNMALLLRRFFLHLNRIGARPRVFMSTATCANAEEHAHNLTGRDVKVVRATNSLRPSRHYFFVKPDIEDFKYRDNLRKRIEQAAITVLSKNLHVLIFCPTKRFLETAFGNCKRIAKRLELDPEKISPYHADLNPDSRREIQQKIKLGEINVVLTTNALELGIDIGGLDGVILAGFPPSIMSAWQQIGRAGRKWDRDAFVLFYAMNDPMDRFYVGNLSAFLNKPFDEFVVDPSNEGLIRNHLPSLSVETEGKLSPSDKKILGDTFYQAGKKAPPQPANFKPQRNLILRGGMGESYNLEHGNEILGTISALRRFREAYIGAIFTFFGRKYVVHAYKEHTIVLKEADSNRVTEPLFIPFLNVTDVFKQLLLNGDMTCVPVQAQLFGEEDSDEIKIIYVQLGYTLEFRGYKLTDESGHLISDGGDRSFYNEKNLHGFAINFPPDRVPAAAIGALEHMIRVGAMFIIPADPFDTSTYSEAQTGKVSAVYYYENYPNGIGLAKKLFDVWKTALRKGFEIAENCKCPTGCPNCIVPAKSYNISNTKIDKNLGFRLAEALLAAEEREAIG